MYVIFYTDKTNIDPDTLQPIDRTLVMEAQAADDAAVQNILGTSNALLSKWDASEYALVMQRNKHARLEMVNAAFEAAMSQLVAGYPEREISSWPRQEKEARAYLADAAAPTPLLDSLSAARGVSKDIIAQKIVEKADAFAKAAGALIGKRQALEDAINAATTTAELEAVVW